MDYSVWKVWALILGVVTLLRPAAILGARCHQRRDCDPLSISHEICDFHKVDNELYRGGRPTCTGLAKLQALGIRTFINLGGAEAAIHGCEDEAIKAGVRFVSVRIPLWQIVLTGVPDDKLRQLFSFMQDAPKPMFISCSLGRDRTGMITALYRIKRGELSFDEALQEAVYYGYRRRFLGLRRALDRYQDPGKLRILPEPSLALQPKGVCLPKDIIHPLSAGD